MHHFESTTLGEALGADPIDENAITELSEEYLLMVHGGNSPPIYYGPPVPPTSSEPSYTTGGGFPQGAPGLVQPGNQAGQNFSDAATYGALHATAEALDIASSAAPFPINYALDKLSDAIRPDGSYRDQSRK